MDKMRFGLISMVAYGYLYSRRARADSEKRSDFSDNESGEVEEYKTGTISSERIAGARVKRISIAS